MKDEDRKLSEKEFEKKYRDIALAPYRRVRLEEKRRREKTEDKKQIEESVAENEKLKLELLTNINTFLLDVAISEKWWTKLRKAVESMVLSDAQTIILLLTRDEEKEDVWTVEAIVSPIKGKGKRWIEVNFGDES